MTGSVPPSRRARSPSPRRSPSPAAWWSEGAWNAYLTPPPSGTGKDAQLNDRLFTKADSDFSDREASIGIGIDPERGTQDGERIYSAHYLRLREGWQLGLFAETAEKTEIHGQRRDLLAELFPSTGTILLGGQQRTCTAHLSSVAPNSRLPLPHGKTDDFNTAKLPALGAPQPQHLVKWVLLTPAIFPEIAPATGATDADGAPLHKHNGGWLPTWVSDDKEHRVLLRAPLPSRDVAHESRDAHRARVRSQDPIAARLVAAIVQKPIPVTGWSLGEIDEQGNQTRTAGAKPTHLAVPAGAVYYFACDSADAARQLAAALNWHGGVEAAVPAALTRHSVEAAVPAALTRLAGSLPPPAAIKNRRSTLLGEKGFGLGVCGTWSPRGGEVSSSK